MQPDVFALHALEIHRDLVRNGDIYKREQVQGKNPIPAATGIDQP